MNRRNARGHMDVGIVPIMFLVLGLVILPNYWDRVPGWGRIGLGVLAALIVAFFLFTRTLPTGMADNARRQMEKQRKRER